MSSETISDEVKPETHQVVNLDMPGLKPVAERLASMKKLMGFMQQYVDLLEKGEESATFVMRFNGVCRAVANPQMESIGIYDGDGVILAVNVNSVPGMISAMSSASLDTAYGLAEIDCAKALEKTIDQLMEKNKTDKAVEKVAAAEAAPAPVVDDSQEDDSRDDSRPAHLREE